MLACIEALMVRITLAQITVDFLRTGAMHPIPLCLLLYHDVTATLLSSSAESDLRL